jgi:hypothetical protein
MEMRITLSRPNLIENFTPNFLRSDFQFLPLPRGRLGGKESLMVQKNAHHH